MFEAIGAAGLRCCADGLVVCYVLDLIVIRSIEDLCAM